MYQFGVKVDDSLLKAEIALLTGGRDLSGCPLITFPALNLQKVDGVGTAGLVQLLRYYFSVSKPDDQQLGFTFVANLQNASPECQQILIDALVFLQKEKRGNVAVVYGIRPKSRTKARALKKLLGLKESKKNPRVCAFKTCLLKSLSELYSQIDRTQLTEDLGGTLPHNQQAWIQFHTMIDPLLEVVTKCQEHLPAAKDRAQLLQDYDTAGLSHDQLQELVKQLEDKYHSIMRELDLESTIDWCKQSHQRLEHPKDDLVLSQISPTLLADTRALLKQSSTALVQARTEMANIWKEADTFFQKLSRLLHYKHDAMALCEEIIKMWLPKVDQPPNIGSTLSQAELYRTFFMTNLYDPAKKLVTQATELLSGIHMLKQEKPANLSSELEFLPRLAHVVQTFTEKLERLQNTYMSVHIFYLMFEKLAQWYQKVLRFLPSTLVAQIEKARREKKSSIPVLPKWAQAVRSFLNKHPGPRNEHISRIEYPVSILPDAQLCSQAKLLAYRIRTLNKILTTTQQFPLGEISSTLAWKRRSLEGNDDIIIPSQIDAQHNKSYNTEGDLDREVADIGNITDSDIKSDLRERPATALGITDKKSNSVTFASDIENAGHQRPSAGKKELSKSIGDLTCEASHVDSFSFHGMQGASSFDILPDNGGSSSARVGGERYISLNYSSEFRDEILSGADFTSTLPTPGKNQKGRFKLPPTELEKLLCQQQQSSPADESGSVVQQLQQIMNSGLTAEEKLQQAQLVLHSSQQPSPQSPFFIGGNDNNPRFSLDLGNQTREADLSQFYHLSPRTIDTGGTSDWAKWASQSHYNTLTKSMPNLDDVEEGGSKGKIPSPYNLNTVLNFRQSEVELSSDFNSNSPQDMKRSQSTTEVGPPGDQETSEGRRLQSHKQEREVKSARETRSTKRVDDWVQQHAHGIHQDSSNLDADAESDDGYSEGSNRTAQDWQRRRLKKSRQDSRKKDDGEVRSENHYGDMLMEIERMNQENVESSLKRAQKILEEEEFNLHQRKTKSKVDQQSRNQSAPTSMTAPDVTPTYSLDESAELPDSDQLDSPGLSLDSSKSDRTVPSVSTDRGYISSNAQKGASPAENRDITRRQLPKVDHQSILRTMSSDSTSTVTSQEPSPTPDSRASPDPTSTRRKSILRQPKSLPNKSEEMDDTAPVSPNTVQFNPHHVPVIKGLGAQSRYTPSKSLQDLLSLDEESTETRKPRLPCMKGKLTRGNRRLSLITFTPSHTTDMPKLNDSLSASSRRLSMETIVEVPKQEEGGSKDSAESRINRRRRRRSDLKLGLPPQKDQFHQSGSRRPYTVSAATVNPYLMHSNSSQHSISGNRKSITGLEKFGQPVDGSTSQTRTVLTPAERRDQSRNGCKQGNEDTSTSEVLSVDSYTSTGSKADNSQGRQSSKNSSGSESDRRRSDRQTKDYSSHRISRPGSADTVNGTSTAKDISDSFRRKFYAHMKQNDDPNTTEGSPQLNGRSTTPQTNGDMSEGDAIAEGNSQRARTDQNDTDEDINGLSVLDEGELTPRKTRLRRDSPSTRSTGSESGFTMRGTRGESGVSPRKQYVRKNIKDLSNKDWGSSTLPRMRLTDHHKGYTLSTGSKLMADDDAWSLYR